MVVVAVDVATRCWWQRGRVESHQRCGRTPGNGAGRHTAHPRAAARLLSVGSAVGLRGNPISPPIMTLNHDESCSPRPQWVGVRTEAFAYSHSPSEAPRFSAPQRGRAARAPPRSAAFLRRYLGDGLRGAQRVRVRQKQQGRLRRCCLLRSRTGRQGQTAGRALAYLSGALRWSMEHAAGGTGRLGPGRRS